MVEVLGSMLSGSKSGMIKDETYLHYQEHDENIKTFSKTLNQ